MDNSQANEAKRIHGPEDIPLWERYLSQASDAYRTRVKDWAASNRDAGFNFRTGPVDRCEFMLKLLRMGLSVEEVSDGFLIHGRIILAVSKRRFRVKGKAGWKNYRSLKQVVSSTFAVEACRDVKKEKAIVSPPKAVGPHLDPTFLKDLQVFSAAGLKIAPHFEGVLINHKYLVRRNTRSWRSVSGMTIKWYTYSDPAQIVRLASGGGWIRNEDSEKAAEARQAKQDAEDRERCVAYEMEQDERAKLGKKPLRGGAASTGPHRTSGFYGVAWNRTPGRWGVMVSRPHVGGEAPTEDMKRVGFFDSVLEAALAFDQANIAMRGRYAHTNFPFGSKLVEESGIKFVWAPDGSRTYTPEGLPKLDGV